MIQKSDKFPSSFRYVKINAEKQPIEKAWQITANYSWGDPEFQEYLMTSPRYSILMGKIHDGLEIVGLDFDQPGLAEKVRPLLPPTFEDRSARRKLPHLIFYTDHARSFKIQVAKKDNSVDIQGPGKLLIGPGSVLNGGTCEVAEDRPIAFCSMAEIEAALASVITEVWQ